MARAMYAGAVPDLFEYDSVSAAYNAAGTLPLVRGNQARWRQNFGPNGEMIKSSEMAGDPNWGKSFDGPVTVEKIKNFILTGWDDGLDKIHKAFGDIVVPELPDIRRKGRWSEIGDDLSLDRLYGGNERMWRTSKRGVRRVPPPLHIIVDQGVNCGPDGMFWRGAAPVAFAEKASMLGYRIGVTSGIFIHRLNDRGASFLAVTKIKGYNDPLNLAATAAMVAHPISSRIMDFGHCCQISEQATSWGGVGRVSIEMLKARGVIDDKAIHILMPCTISTKENAMKWINDTVAQMTHLVETGEWVADLEARL